MTFSDPRPPAKYIFLPFFKIEYTFYFKIQAQQYRCLNVDANCYFLDFII